MAHGGHRHAVDSDGGRTISCRIGNGAIGLFAIRSRVRTGRKPCFINNRTCGALDWQVKRYWTVGNGYGQRCDRRIAVTVGNCIGEHIRNTAGRTGIANIAIAAVSVNRQHAVKAIYGGTCGPRFACASHIGDNDAVRALHILAAVAFAVGNDIASGRTIGACRNAVGIGYGGRCIIDNRDDQCRVGGVAVAVGKDNVERVARGSCQRVIVKRIAVIVNAA